MNEPRSSMTERWPRLLSPPVASGSIRHQPQDFIVEEIPAYLPCGQGEHVFVELQKTDLTTDKVIREFAQYFQVSPNEIGTAGMKDRRAVTRQWISLPHRNNALTIITNFSHPNMEIRQVGLHNNKLKTGHLKGNRFDITVRGIDPAYRQEIDQRCQQLITTGVPNYFGPQRFGPDGINEQKGLRILLGGKKRCDRRGLRFLLNAVQAAMFNDLLALRISENLFSRALLGDILVKGESGGCFVCTDAEGDQTRIDRFEIHPTGPMFGPKMMQPENKPAQMEALIMQRYQIGQEQFKRFSKLTRGARRALRIDISCLQASWEKDGSYRLRFQLPSGSYATTLINELINMQDPG